MPEGTAPGSLRVAAVGDIHCTTASAASLARWLRTLPAQADVLLLCGDLTDHGRVEEARVLADALRDVPLPRLAVLGNHDYFAGASAQIVATLREAGVAVLDGDAVELGGVGFVGVKGFVGGFDAHALRPRPEPGIAALLADTTVEAQKLEAGLARLGSARRVVMMHYAPISATIAHEAPKTHAFFGSSALEVPLLRHPVDAVFHGHAHAGPPQGTTARGTPVYNVAAPLLARIAPHAPPYRVVSV